MPRRPGQNTIGLAAAVCRARARPCRACHPAWCWQAAGRARAPLRRRRSRGAPVDPFAVTFVKVFALVPALLATIFAVVAGRALPIGGAAPLVVLSGLAVVIAAGDSIELYHQRILGFAWAGLLMVPAMFVPVLILLLPWTVGTDLEGRAAGGRDGPLFRRQFRAPRPAGRLPSSPAIRAPPRWSRSPRRAGRASFSTPIRRARPG